MQIYLLKLPRFFTIQPKGWCHRLVYWIIVLPYEHNLCLLSFDSIYRFHFILNQVLRETGMASTACFIIVSRNDIPIYEAEVGSATKREDAAQLHQFILHAALDIVQDLAWTTSAMFLKAIDRFNDLVVSVYVTAGHILFMCELISISGLEFLLFN
ncbi:hypothetical protein QYF36_019637 [Acer negundo]|nr:hypothetical protein QYF36_019637 [Acer negundo]